MKYRADIDGLRTIAVIPVLFYHAGLGFPGGFVGVDVFFVISGYLITFLIISELNEHRFSILNFYERRARRLFPALFSMMLITFVAAAIIMVPLDLREFGKSIISTTLFAGNIWFYSQEGYFNEAAELQPLLHTWSLGVEEQYYVLFPVILIALSRFFSFKLLFASVAILAVVSFIASVIMLPNEPEAVFFLPHLRAWELLIGSLLGLAAWRGWLARLSTVRSGMNLISLIGLAAVMWPILTYSPETPFPAMAAMAPCLGAALLIIAGNSPQHIVAHWLSLRPMVFVGKLSYSLYLWHWPVISLAFYMLGALSAFQGIVCLLISTILAYASWRFVEQPFRSARAIGQRAIFAGSFGAIAIALGVGVAFWKLDGLPSRMEPSLLEMANGENYLHDRRDCHKVTPQRAEEGNVCLRGSTDATPSFALIGDSHADAISPAIFEAAQQLGLAGYQYTNSGFVPLPGTTRSGQSEADQIDALFAFLDARPSLETLIITGFWQRVFTGYTYRNAGVVLADDNYDGSGTAYNPKAATESLQRLAGRFPDRQIILLDDVPTGEGLHIRAHLRLLRFNTDQVAGLTRTEKDEQRLTYEPYFIDIAEKVDNLHYLPFFKDICGVELCHLFDGDILLYRDGDHLSWGGALQQTDRATELLSSIP
jgi:peptidoglycan/LPS O-acetylase OafA/YrhL